MIIMYNYKIYNITYYRTIKGFENIFFNYYLN